MTLRDNFHGISHSITNHVAIHYDLLRNFSRRKEFEVKNYRQTVYDYASIMHFGKDYFSNDGKELLSIAKAPEYACQEDPARGQRASLSANDVIKLNQMYNCPGSGYGVPGHLKVHIRHGIDLNLKGHTQVTCTFK